MATFTIDPASHWLAVQAELWLALVTALAVAFVVAPYGRHARGGWGPAMPARLGWVVMEAPASLVAAAIFLSGPNAQAGSPAAWALFLLWQVHYVHRAFVYPLRMRASGKRMPVLVCAMAVAFNLLNAYVCAGWIGHVGDYPAGGPWLTPWFAAGATLFVAGFVLNLHSDHVLTTLRAPGETGYRIPDRGLHRLVASPNYLGEILEWCGWALASASLAGLAFAVYTTANLAPRARSNLRWYRETFPDYPAHRRALVPGLW